MILSSGEALFDMIARPEGSGRVFQPVIGGSTLNVAFGLARLGRPVAYLTRLARDSFGDELFDFLTREGIDTRFVTRSDDDQTMMVFVTLDASGHPTYRFYAAGCADRNMTAAHLPAALPDDITALHFGSNSLVFEPQASTLTAFLKAEASRRVIALDPNVRASIITDRPAWLARLDDVRARADIVKASSEDVAWIEGKCDDIADVARRWSLGGPHVAFITDGDQGAAVAIGGESVTVPAHAVALVDTVGAGDTFQAAMLARLDEDGHLTKDRIRRLTLSQAADIARFAVAAAALTCSRRGADLPRRADVETFLAANATRP